MDHFTTEIAADIEEKELEWLWPYVIPMGMLTILAGDPDVGKGFFVCDLAARVTQGMEIADGARVTEGAVLYLSAEDDPARTIVPRLKAAHANLFYVHIGKGMGGHKKHYLTDEVVGTNRPLNLIQDFEEFADEVKNIHNLRLIIIDTISDYLGGVEGNSNMQVRQALSPLRQLAEEQNVAIVLISHMNKNSETKALYRTLGSIAWTALPRASWLLTLDPNDQDRRLFVPTKFNLIPNYLKVGRAFTLKDQRGFRQPWVKYEREPIWDYDVDELLGNSSIKGPNKMQMAIDLIREELADGKKIAVTELEAKAKKAGIGERTLTKARKYLGVKSDKSPGKGGCWICYMPSSPESAKPTEKKDKKPIKRVRLPAKTRRQLWFAEYKKRIKKRLAMYEAEKGQYDPCPWHPSDDIKQKKAA